ncbi:MAG: hypothetical protein CUN52_09770 [Phototrophicales bacterium]|nr:MAG: hypothetical protein CUN52_09770 [Phototrophicales bacterium]
MFILCEQRTKVMKRKLVLLAILISMMLSAVASVSAQDRITERYNQILTHLASYLGLSAPIRFVDSWTWEEIIGTNAGFDCPAPGVVYPSSPNRYLKFIINYNGQRYDYRVNGDGTILILCGPTGQPLVRLENGINVLTPIISAPPAPTTITISPAPWYAWFYLPTLDRLILFNQNGEVASVNRPRLTNEAPSSSNLHLAISRDGRYLVQTVTVSPNTPTLSIYDFATGTLRGIPLNTTDTARMGGVLVSYAASTGTPLAFSPDSRSVAVGVGRVDTPGVNEWRIMVVNLETGSITRQVRHNEIGAILVAPSVEVSQAITGGFGTFLPNIQLWDNLGNIHFQLVFMFAGGALTYPAIAWNPTTNSATVSPYNRSSADILPTDGSIVYSDNDPALPAIPSMGMLETQNVIRRGMPIGTSMTPQQLLHSPNYSMLSPRWITGGTQIAFLFEDNVNPVRWGIYTIGSASPFLQLSDGYKQLAGVSNGAVTTAQGFDVYIITWHQNGNTPTNIGTFPTSAGEPIIVWTQPFNVALGLTTLVTTPTSTSTTSPASPTAIPTSSVVVPVGASVLCPGAPASIVRTGITGRVFVGGPNRGPLNVRQTPSTSAPIVRIIPEGTRFAIIGGPQCANNFTWWQVRLDDGVVAWVAEGTSAQYFIEPAP